MKNSSQIRCKMSSSTKTRYGRAIKSSTSKSIPSKSRWINDEHPLLPCPSTQNVFSQVKSVLVVESHSSNCSSPLFESLLLRPTLTRSHSPESPTRGAGFPKLEVQRLLETFIAIQPIYVMSQNWFLMNTFASFHE